MSPASLQGATGCQVLPLCFLPHVGSIELLWVQPQPSTAFLKVSPKGPGPPSHSAVNIYICHLRGYATLSTRFPVWDQVRSKEEISSHILAGTQPRLEVGDTEIIGGKGCEAIQINF